jgi:hypothetical protein
MSLCLKTEPRKSESKIYRDIIKKHSIVNKAILYWIIVITSGLVLTNCTTKQNANSWSVSSPDSTLVVNVKLDRGKVFYSVLDALSGDTVIFKSAMGVLAQDQNFRFAKILFTFCLSQF